MENDTFESRLIRQEERMNALKDDIIEFKESEKEYGLKTDANIRDIYEKIHGLNARVVGISTTIAIASSAIGIIVQYFLNGK